MFLDCHRLAPQRREDFRLTARDITSGPHCPESAQYANRSLDSLVNFAASNCQRNKQILKPFESTCFTPYWNIEDQDCLPMRVPDFSLGKSARSKGAPLAECKWHQYMTNQFSPFISAQRDVDLDEWQLRSNSTNRRTAALTHRLSGKADTLLHAEHANCLSPRIPACALT